MYELSPSHYLRAGAASVAGGIGLGVAAALLLPLGRGIPFLGLMIGLIVGAAAGTAMAEALTRATKGKRGLTMQAIAGTGLGLAWLTYLVLTDSLIPLRLDLIGVVAAVMGIVAAAQRLR
jgi:hypothetical protein